jgi:hypothetical protein
LLEFDALFIMEFARGIRRFEEQPISVEYPLNGRIRRYTPDFGIEWKDGRRWFVEVKPSEKLAEPRTAEKFDALARWFSSKGDHLLVLTEKEIRRPIRLSQIRDLVSAASTAPLTEVTLLPAFAEAGASIAEMRAAGIDIKLIRQLLGNRSLTCNLDCLIDDETIVRPYAETDDATLFV